MNPFVITKEMKIGAAAVVALLLFLAGYFTHAKFFGTEVKTVTVTVPVQVAAKETPQVEHGKGVITPAVKIVEKQPVAPVAPMENPTVTTVVHIPEVPVSVKLDVFHQNKLRWKQEGKGITAWVDSRIWTLGADGKPVPGVTSESLFTKEAVTNIQLPVDIPVTKSRPWSAGVIYGLTEKGWGGYLDRDVGPLRFGVEASHYQTHSTVGVKAGIRF